MLFSKAIGAVLTLASVVASQVIVTVTDTVTVVTVTVTPTTTSTSTAYVTVEASAPPSTTPRPTILVTITSTATLTKATAVATTCPISLHNQCGGERWSGCTTCASGATCESYHRFYHYCVTTAKVVTVTKTVYKTKG